MNIIIVEDEGVKNLRPITYLHYSYDIRIGILSLIESIKRRISNKHTLYVLPLEKIWVEKVSERINGIEIWDKNRGGESILVNSRVLYTPDFEHIFLELLQNPSKPTVYKSDSALLIMYVDRELDKYIDMMMKNTKIINEDNKFQNYQIELPTLDYYWDVVKYSKKLIKYQLKKFYNISQNEVALSKDVYMESNVNLVTRDGPIMIEKNAELQGPSRIEGPAFIGVNSLVAACANIRQSYIGAHCNVGGEITRSIISDFSNSRHQSYIGDSYIGEFVNIGALTVVSNLKNTYGPIRAWINGKKVNTGMKKFGVVIGDHAKISVGTIIYGGISIGISSHVHYKARKPVPSFTIWWGDEEEGYQMDLESTIKMIKRFMNSKGIKLSKKYENMIRNVYLKTEFERKLYNVKT